MIEYLMNKSELLAIFIEYRSLFFEGIKVTLIIAVLGTFFGTILGAGLAALRIQEPHYKDSLLIKLLKKSVRLLALLYIDIVRGTPMMVQASLFFYGVVANILEPNIAGIFIVSFNTAAYIAEILRSGINSIDKGQLEAARCVGLSNFQAMRRVILPQAVKNTVPALCNELIVNIKDSSVLSVIQVTELFYSAKSAASETYRTTESYLITAIIYLIMTVTLTRLLNYFITKTANGSNQKKTSLPSSQTVKEVL